MRIILCRLLAIVCLMVLPEPAISGNFTANEFLYKPSVGARGAGEKEKFDAGLDRIDARLSKEIWVGDPNHGATLQDAVAVVGGTKAILRVPAGTHSITDNLTIPANVTLKVERGATLAIATAKTLTINGGLDAGPYQIFSCAGTGKVVFGAGSVTAAYTEWWGAAGDGTTEDTAAFNAALASTAAPIQLLGKTYVISGLHIDGPSMGHCRKISGAGMGKTILQAKAGSTYLLNFTDSYWNEVKDLSLYPVTGMTSIIRGYCLNYAKFDNVWVGYATDPGVDNGINGITIEGAPSHGSYSNQFNHVYITNISGKLVYFKNDDADNNSRTNHNEFNHCMMNGINTGGPSYHGIALYMAAGNANRFVNCYCSNCATSIDMEATAGGAAPTDNYIELHIDPATTAYALNAGHGNKLLLGGNTTLTHAIKSTIGNVLIDRYNTAFGASVDANSGLWNYAIFNQMGGIFNFYKDTAEAKPRMYITNYGILTWGDGTNTADTELYRYSSNLLYTPDQFWAADGLVTKVKAGTLSDSDFVKKTDGCLGIDSTNGRLYFRHGGGWHYCSQAAGFEINAKDAYDHLVGPEAKFKKGDIVLGIVTDFKADGAPHCEYVTLGKALEQLGYRR